MTTIPVSELQNLNGYSIIELFELHLVDGLHYRGGYTPENPYPTNDLNFAYILYSTQRAFNLGMLTDNVFRFHNGTNEKNGDIIWNGQTYTAIACEASGWESSNNTTMARPTINFANNLGLFTTLVEFVNLTTPFNDLQGAKIIRIRTLAQFLDDDNFNGTNPYGSANPQMEIERQEYEINKKILENIDVCSFELVNSIDYETLQLPRNQITKDRFPMVGSYVFV